VAVSVKYNVDMLEACSLASESTLGLVRLLVLNAALGSRGSSNKRKVDAEVFSEAAHGFMFVQQRLGQAMFRS